MKKLLLALFACTVLLCGCVSDEDYDEMKIQYEAKLSQKDEQITKLETELNDLKNSASIQLSRVREAFFLGKYQQVVNLTEQLYKTHPDSDEYLAAAALSKTAQRNIDDQAKKEEQEREQRRKEKMQNTLRIYQSIVSEVDSAGGVDLKVSYNNTSDKTINYITFTVEVYNAVGDIVSDEITDKSIFNLKETGPIGPGGGSIKSTKYEYKRGEAKEVDVYYGTTWENVLYNKTAKKIVITGILIEYSDDSTTKISGDDLKYLYY